MKQRKLLEREIYTKMVNLMEVDHRKSEGKWLDLVADQLQELDFMYKLLPLPSLINVLSLYLDYADTKLRQLLIYRGHKQIIDEPTLNYHVATQSIKLPNDQALISYTRSQQRKLNRLVADRIKQLLNICNTLRMENLMYNINVAKQEVNAIQEKYLHWDEAKARVIMQQLIRQYKGLSMPQILMEHYGHSSIAHIERRRALLRRSQIRETSNGHNNDNSQKISASSSIAVRKNKTDKLQNSGGVTAKIGMDQIQKVKVLHLDPIKTYFVIKRMVHQYKGLYAQLNHKSIAQLKCQYGKNHITNGTKQIDHLALRNAKIKG